MADCGLAEGEGEPGKGDWVGDAASFSEDKTGVLAGEFVVADGVVLGEEALASGGLVGADEELHPPNATLITIPKLSNVE